MWKEDSTLSVAELLYGTMLSLPSDLVNRSVAPDVYATNDFVADLRKKMSKIVQPPVKFHSPLHGDQESAVPASLLRSPFVFVRRGPRTTPLQQP